MKKYLVSASLILCISALFAQDAKVLSALEKSPSIAPGEDQGMVYDVVQPCVAVQLNGEQKAVEKRWKTYMKDKQNVDLKNSKGMMVAEEVQMLNVSPDTINIYTRVREASVGGSLDMFIKKGDSFITTETNPDEVERVKTLLETFAKEFYVSYYEDIIASRAKEREKAQKELDKVLKTEAKLQKNIASKDKAIAKSDGVLSKLESKIESVSADKKKLNEDTSRAQETLDKQNVDQATLTADIGKKRNSLSQELDNITEEHKDYDKVNKELNKLISKNDKQKKLIAKSTKTIDKLESKSSKVEGKLTDLRSKRDKTQAEKEESERAKMQFQSEMEANGVVVKERMKTVGGLDTSLEKLRAAAAGARSSFN